MSSLPFHPIINAWFAETYGKPTAVQEEAWPLIANGDHVLALAPTGSGKTLTGFLAAISRFADGAYEAEELSVLYVSPLKALNEDIRRNLISPLKGIQSAFEKAGEPFPAIRVDTRSGDTPQSERKRFLSMPPSILALTPESLSIILLNPRGRQVLSTVRYVIIDEIHAALGSKRGSFLSCQIDRLAMTAGEFQRVALSATVKPPEAAADFAGGLKKTQAGYEQRKVRIVEAEEKKKLEFQVVYPDTDSKDEEKEAAHTGVDRYGKRYTELIKFIIERIKARSGGQYSSSASSTILVFTDSRRRAERISFLLNRAAEEDQELAGKPLAYTHHGSLSKEVRRSVEKALADGEISCVAATGSLELGIDIGGVDEVILAGSPGSAAVALQRIGRSGHGVGRTSRGWLIPFHGMDLLQAAAVSGAVEERELETTSCIENPLDLLAQIILALCAEKERNEDELYEVIRGFYVYRNLARESYNGVIRMLSGAYEETRLRELKRHIFRDDETKILTAAPGALILLYTSGGVITSTGYYSLRLAPGTEGAGTKIGELEEEFVWERRLGDCFDFGNRSWKITNIGDEAVEAIPLSRGVDSVPFWKGETVYRSPNLSRRVLEVLDGYYPKAWTSIKAEKMLDHFSGEAKEALEDFLHSQWSFQKGMPMPGPSFIPIEIMDDPVGRGDSYPIIIYSFRGGAINLPLSLALAQDIEKEYGQRVQGTADDNAVFLRLPRSTGSDPASTVMDSLCRIAADGKGERYFKDRLESSGVFGAAFRESAERSLVLPRSPFGKRMPLWITRQKSKRLFDAVRRYNDFPATAEAWRACLKEKFDMEGFSSLLEEIGSGSIVVDFFKTRKPSPFAYGLSWAENNALMYEYDERPDLLGPPSDKSPGPSLSDEVIASALGNAALRPVLKNQLVNDFCSRLRRELSGWAPEDALNLSEWVKERFAIPSNGLNEEWEKLLQYIPPELAQVLQEDKTLGGKIEFIKRENAGTGVMVHREWAKKWKNKDAAALARDCLGRWLRFQGPIPLARIMEVFGLSQAEAETAVNALYEQCDLAHDVATEEGNGLVCDMVCDRENLELLLRLSRRKSRPELKERPAKILVPFLARRQGLAGTGACTADVNAPWKKLCGITAAAKLWESEFFPCRCPSYSGEMFDREIREGRLVWYGAGREKAAFCTPEELDLLAPVSPAPDFNSHPSGDPLPADFFDTPRSFWEIKDALLNKAEPASINDCAIALWEEVWKGSLSSDSWEPMRRALENGFTFQTADPGASIDPDRNAGRRSFRVPRAIRERWRTGPPVRGNWFSLAGDDGGLNPPDSPLEEEELNRERVRLLLNRFGILARPLLEKEAPLLSWSKLLPAIRRMELAGELVAGRFFSGINSLQFATLKIAEELENAEADNGIYWMNAADPASPAGLSIEGILSGCGTDSNQTIRRVSSSRLCFRGAELLAASSRGGKDLEIYIKPDDPDITGALSFIKIPKTRNVHPENKITIEKVNGKAAGASVYSSILSGLGFVKDRGKMVLW